MLPLFLQTAALAALLLTASCAVTHRESLDIHELKTSSEHEFYNHLVEYQYVIHQENETFSPLTLFEQLSQIRSLQSFKLSFALGNLRNELDFHLPQRLPRFGSFLTTNCDNDEDFVSLGFVLGGHFSFANGRITSFERLCHSSFRTYWYSYNPEQLCVEHLFKIGKILPSQGMSRLLTRGDTVAVKYEYSSLELQYERLGRPG
jgi:hypothetical protein